MGKIGLDSFIYAYVSNVYICKLLGVMYNGSNKFQTILCYGRLRPSYQLNVTWSDIQSDGLRSGQKSTFWLNFVRWKKITNAGSGATTAMP